MCSGANWRAFSKPAVLTGSRSVLRDSEALDRCSSTLVLTSRLRARHWDQGTRWRRLSAGRQALLVLAHLRRNDTYAQLAAGFSIGAAMACRDVREAVELLSGLEPALGQVVDVGRHKALVIRRPLWTSPALPGRRTT
ncbi:helix-turn-helix domain-containing protein [Streptomyces sp. NPDC005009]